MESSEGLSPSRQLRAAHTSNIWGGLFSVVAICRLFRSLPPLNDANTPKAQSAPSAPGAKLYAIQGDSPLLMTALGSGQSLDLPESLLVPVMRAEDSDYFRFYYTGPIGLLKIYIH